MNILETAVIFLLNGAFHAPPVLLKVKIIFFSKNTKVIQKESYTKRILNNFISEYNFL